MSLSAQCTLCAGARAIDASIEATAGSRLVVVGPNGAGKTTLLRSLAGLSPLDEGCIVLEDVTFDDPKSGAWVPPEQRHVGYVPQERFLFPHLSVLDNVAFPVRNRAVARHWLKRASLEAFADRKPASLSGGEAARVAILRALAAEPRMLLLDEPLSALDAAARSEMRTFLDDVLESFDGVTIMVTHNPIEALTTANEIVVIEEGRVTQHGSAATIVGHPRTEYVARFLGLNLIRGRAEGTHVRTHDAVVIIAEPAPTHNVLLSFPASAVSLTATRPESAARNLYDCVVREIVHEGARLRVTLSGPLPLTAEITRAGGDALALRPGSTVCAAIKATEISVEPE